MEMPDVAIPASLQSMPYAFKEKVKILRALSAFGLLQVHDLPARPTVPLYHQLAGLQVRAETELGNTKRTRQ